MKVSVIVPTFKPYNYILECLSSLKSQTFPNSDFEIIVILNGKKEPYYSALKDFIKRNFSESFHIDLLYSEWGNVSNARNVGLEHAKGDFITFLDDDDYVSSTYLEELYKISNEKTIGQAHPIAFDEFGQRKYILEREYYLIRNNMVDYLSCRRFFQGACMKLFHRSIIMGRRFDTRFKNGEDTLFMFLISNKFKNVAVTSDDAIYYRRVRVDSAFYAPKPFRHLFSNSCKLLVTYTLLYLKDPLSYNFVFYMTRMLGTIKTLLKYFKVSL